MIPSIKLPSTSSPYQDIVSRNNKETVSGTSFSKTISQVKESQEKKSSSESTMSSGVYGLTREEMMSIIQNKVLELKDKLEKDETEPTYQIGSNTFTKKEWDNLILKIDSALEDDDDEVSESEDKDAINPDEKEKIG